jgi:hypothetical protein
MKEFCIGEITVNIGVGLLNLDATTDNQILEI